MEWKKQVFFYKDLFIYYVYSILLAHQEKAPDLYKWLWAPMWFLGIELGTSGRTASSTLNLWAISVVLKYFLQQISWQTLWECQLNLILDFFRDEEFLHEVFDMY